MLPVELWKPSYKSISLPVDRKYHLAIKGYLQILSFNSKYKRRWSNVIFLQDKHNNKAMS
jgi:hypothetical protein